MRNRDKHGTIEYFKRYGWKALNKRTVNGKQSHICLKKNPSYYRKGIELRLTREEFNTFCEDNWDLIKSLYLQNKRPSIDRIDSDGHYELNNMRILDLSLNSGKKVIKIK